MPDRPDVLIAEQFRIHRDPARVFEHRTRLVDSIVEAAVDSSLTKQLNKNFVVAAVGGYGRGELFPYSDVDLLLLFENESDFADIKSPLSEFLRILWDSGLRVSHSVRSLAECCRLNEQNVELHISLLDLRFLCGQQDLFRNLQHRLPEFYQRYAEAITRRMGQLVRNRHSKFNDTVYHLEPSIKECPGGIRDIHLLRWLSQLTPRNEAIRDSFSELESAKKFLFTLRCFLHFQGRRDHNLLTFELQDEVAKVLPEQPIDPAEWMRTYFKYARRIYQASLRALEQTEAQDSSLLVQFRDWRTRLSTPEFTVSRDRVFLRNPASTVQQAGSVLELFTFVARHGIPLSWDAQRRLRTNRNTIEQSLRDHPPTWSGWHELLSQPNAALALTAMQETGFLVAAIPEWQSIDSLVVRDFYHRYTVDEHTLVAMGVVDGLAAEKANSPRRIRQLLQEDDDPAVLRLALLLHDLGKGTKPGDHVQGSLDAASQIMTRLGVPDDTQQTVLFLVEHHLDLSLIMNGRDLDDPATARYLTSRVDAQDRLRRLAILTYADISAVNPTAMTPWRLEQLWRVYAMGSEQLTRELATDRIQHALASVSGASVSPELAQFLEGFPTRYLRTHTLEEIEHHFALEQRSHREGVAVELTRRADAYLVAVVAQDRAGLFSLVCGALASFGMNIVKAEAFGNSLGSALELMRFTDPMRTLELNPGEIDRLQHTIEQTVKGNIPVADLLKRRRALSRPSRGARILPAVNFNKEASDFSTLIDFVGEDRPGLLYDLTSALNNAGCNIEVVMIDTEAHKAIDVFYVTHNGQKLDEPLQERLRSDLIRAAVPS
jgi:[protein-PII] uridylyltransferase